MIVYVRELDPGGGVPAGPFKRKHLAGRPGRHGGPGRPGPPYIYIYIMYIYYENMIYTHIVNAQFSLFLCYVGPNPTGSLMT